MIERYYLAKVLNKLWEAFDAAKAAQWSTQAQEIAQQIGMLLKQARSGRGGQKDRRRVVMERVRRPQDIRHTHSESRCGQAKKR